MDGTLALAARPAPGLRSGVDRSAPAFQRWGVFSWRGVAVRRGAGGHAGPPWGRVVRPAGVGQSGARGQCQPVPRWPGAFPTGIPHPQSGADPD